MKRAGFYTAGVAALALAGCATNEMYEPVDWVDYGPQAVTADVRGTNGATVAQATATEVADSIRVRVEAAGMPAGAYAAHVHTTGRCDPPDFQSAGGHWNPTNQEHGKDNPQGMHKGDLPNLMVGTDGRGALEVTVPNVSVAGGAINLLDADGAALVIHERGDDYRSNPAGNAGSRIACGIFR